MPPLGQSIGHPVDPPLDSTPSTTFDIGHSGARWMMAVGLCLVMLGLACTF